MRSSTDIELKKHAYDIAWRWFELHANQRLLLFRFYIFFVGICFAGYLTSVEKKIAFGECFIPILGLVISYSFRRIDARTSRLIKISEAALKELQKDISTVTYKSKLRLLENADDLKKGELTYTKIFTVIQFATYMIFVFAFFVSIDRISDALCPVLKKIEKILALIL